METSILSNMPLWALIFLFIVQIWDLFWKGFGLWKSSKNNHPYWFILILVLNTVGILPLIYLGWFDKSKENKLKLLNKNKNTKYKKDKGNK